MTTPNDSTASETVQASTYGERWIHLAPDPPRRAANLYDAFISYRSSDRGWAMALYDALKLCGWKPFLDQFELVPGANLETSLEESLQASSSGVILWSKKTGDSDWCKRERQGMWTMQRQNPAFHYLFAKLDEKDLPLFAQTDLYVDFQDSPEGPRGVNLLRLMCGMRGIPLSDEAVRLAQDLDAANSKFLLQVKGAAEAGNAARLLELGMSTDPKLLASSLPLLEAARGLISNGSPNQALQVLQRAEQNFPDSIVMKQLKGLALRRLKRFQEAIDVLSELTAAGHQDPETLGILAASWDGRYLERGKPLYLRKARELYRTAFQVDPRSYYAGINAASKSLFLGEAEEAARLAGLVLPIVQHAQDGNDFWEGCTLAEILLLKGDLTGAAGQYQKMVDCYPARVGDLTGTLDQAQRICVALGLSKEQQAQVLAAFQYL